MALQPVEGLDHPDDVAALSYAEKNIGDFKLKTSANYKVTNPQERETTLKKYRQIILSRRKVRLKAIKYMKNRLQYEKYSFSVRNSNIENLHTQ